MRLIVLVGLPGSGKSTHRNKLGLPYVNQDELGSRDACVEMATKYIKEGHDVVIDRTNISKKQRSNWVKLAKYLDVEEIICIEFKSDPYKCIERITKREHHETIPQTTSLDKIKQIVLRFNKEYEVPTLDEGFTTIGIIYTDPIPG